MGIKFVKEVPAQIKTSKGRSARIVAQLEANPNEWAIAYRTTSRSLATSRGSALRKLGAEVMTRTEKGRVVVYARVTGVSKKSVKRTRKAQETVK